MVPLLRQGQYFAAISAGVDQMMRADRRRAAAAARSHLAAPAARRATCNFLPFVLFAVLFGSSILRSHLRPRGRRCVDRRRASECWCSSLTSVLGAGHRRRRGLSLAGAAVRRVGGGWSSRRLWWTSAAWEAASAVAALAAAAVSAAAAAALVAAAPRAAGDGQAANACCGICSAAPARTRAAVFAGRAGADRGGDRRRGSAALGRDPLRGRNRAAAGGAVARRHAARARAAGVRASAHLGYARTTTAC